MNRFASIRGATALTAGFDRPMLSRDLQPLSPAFPGRAHSGDLPENKPEMSFANMNGPMKVELITSTMLRAITATK